MVCLLIRSIFCASSTACSGLNNVRRWLSYCCYLSLRLLTPINSLLNSSPQQSAQKCVSFENDEVANGGSPHFKQRSTRLSTHYSTYIHGCLIVHNPQYTNNLAITAVPYVVRIAGLLARDRHFSQVTRPRVWCGMKLIVSWAMLTNWCKGLSDRIPHTWQWVST